MGRVSERGKHGCIGERRERYEVASIDPRGKESKGPYENQNHEIRQRACRGQDADGRCALLGRQGGARRRQHDHDRTGAQQRQHCPELDEAGMRGLHGSSRARTVVISSRVPKGLVT
jgi:hypothetical protein